MVGRGGKALLLVVAGCLPLPLAAVVSQSFQVSASVVAGCLVVGGVSNYGSLDFGSRSALSTATVQAALSTGDRFKLRAHIGRDGHGLTLAHHGQWILVTTVDPELKMQVRPGAVARSAYGTHDLALLYFLANLNAFAKT